MLYESKQRPIVNKRIVNERMDYLCKKWNGNFDVVEKTIIIISILEKNRNKLFSR